MSTYPCPALEALERFSAASDAVAGTGDGLAAHVDTCAACRRTCEMIRQNNVLLGNLKRAQRGGRNEVAHRFANSVPGYRILEDIGAGGQGVVYRAVQIATKRTVALKVIIGGDFADARRRERFSREVELVASLTHPNIVTIFDSGVSPEGRCYYAMEFIDGEPLDQFIFEFWLLESRGSNEAIPARRDHAARRSGEGSQSKIQSRRAGTKSKIDAALRLFAKICDALAAAHVRGIVHRDLKPANILVDQGGVPHVLDFGLAKALIDDPLATRPAVAVTVSGEFMGTFAYAAPEQLRGRPELIDVRTDVYALGVMLYELLAGRRPYPLGQSISEAAHAISEIEPPRPSSVQSGLDDELDTIALKALAKEPARRYQSAGELRRDIQRYLAGEPIDAKRDSTWYVLRKTARKHRTTVIGAAAAALFLLVFGISMALLARRVELQRQRADETAHSLARTLGEANIERGRLMTETGNIPVAERLLWHEYLTHAADSTIARQAHWALWELYSRHPCLATLPRGSNLRAVAEWTDDDVGLVLATQKGGHIEEWDLATLTQILSLQLVDYDMAGALELDTTAMLVWGGTRTHLQAWDIATGDKWLSIDISDDPLGPGYRVFDVSPDSSHVVFARSSGELALHDARDGRWVASIGSPDWLNGPCRRLRFVRDAATVIAVGIDNRAAIWQPRLGLCNEILPCLPRCWGHQPLPIAVSLDGRLIALEGELAPPAGGVHVIDIAAQIPSCDVLLKGGNLQSIDISPDGREFAICTGDRIIRVFDTRDCKLESELAGNTAWADALRFNSTGDLLTTTALDGLVKLWEVRRTATVRISGHPATLMSLAFTPDGSELICGSASNRVMAFDPRTGAVLRTYAGHTAEVSGVAVSPDGRLVASASYDGTARVWERNSARELCVLPTPEFVKANDLAFSPDGRVLAVASDDAFVRLWDFEPFAASGHARAAAHEEGARLRDFEQTRCIAVLGRSPGRVATVRYSPDGRWIAAVGPLGGWVWDAAALSIHFGTRNARAAAFHPNSQERAEGSDDGMVTISNMTPPGDAARLEAHQQSVFSVCYSPDGKLIASGDRGGIIMLWDAATGRNLAKIAQHTEMIFCVAFSPDGRYLASCGADRSVAITDLSHFDQHIAGNLECQLARLESSSGAPDIVDRAQRRAWAAEAWRRSGRFLQPDR